MIDYPSAATIAFRITGDEPATTLFEETARQLQADWRGLEERVHALIPGMNCMVE